LAGAHKHGVGEQVDDVVLVRFRAALPPRVKCKVRTPCVTSFVGFSANFGPDIAATVDQKLEQRSAIQSQVRAVAGRGSELEAARSLEALAAITSPPARHGAH
jgi:alpha/beta superfamily hydrolase